MKRLQKSVKNKYKEKIKKTEKWNIEKIKKKEEKKDKNDNKIFYKKTEN